MKHPRLYYKENYKILTKEFEDNLGTITIGSEFMAGVGGDSGESVVECMTASSEFDELEEPDVLVVDSKSRKLKCEKWIIKNFTDQHY